MFVEAQLVFRSYMPNDGLQKGMLFLTHLSKEPHIYVLDKMLPNEEEFMKINGFPVRPYIIHQGNPNIHYKDQIIYAHPEQIGWMDEGEDSDELYDIEIKNMNKILSDFNGWVYIEVDNDGFPVLYDDKVTIRYAIIDDEYEIDEDADDEPEHDSAGFTEDDRIDPEEKYWRDAQTWSERHSNTNDDDYNHIF